MAYNMWCAGRLWCLLGPPLQWLDALKGGVRTRHVCAGAFARTCVRGHRPADVEVQGVHEVAVDGLQPLLDVAALVAGRDGAHKQLDEPGQAVLVHGVDAHLRACTWA